ncbi:MAG: branched-chain amino acid ABC transporter2C amino acid-binding protein [Comamonadaceae bacterium]|nr:MAG: branched-chain amino acid ABC transporter2C amino acid-binding protein [Comamonadaceae bacterium]
MSTYSPFEHSLSEIKWALKKLRQVGYLGFMYLCFAAFPVSAASYTDNGDGTVTDTGIGLIWMRCSMGQTWTGSTCSGNANTYTWDQAVAITGTVNFSSQTDWRLPNILELQSIVDRSRSNPAISPTAFPGTPNSSVWSSTPSAASAANAWYVNFSNSTIDGSAYINPKTNTFAVRMVRSSQSSILSNLARPDSEFVNNGDGTVTHTATGLMWKRCIETSAWDGTSCSSPGATGGAPYMSWDAAKVMTSTFAGKSDWRLATQDELLTIVDYTRSSPALNTTVFPNTPPFSYVYSSTPKAGTTSTGWGVYFERGDVYPTSGGFHVRLVRNNVTVTTSTTTSTSITATSTTTASTTTTTLPSFTITTGNMADGRYMHTATLLPGGKVLIAGGWYQLSKSELYDPATKTFAATGAMSATLGRGDHTATLLPDGKVLVAGGSDPLTKQYLSSAELYDPATGTFSPTGNMTTARTTHTATLLPNGKVLIAGGTTGGSGGTFTPTNSAEIYDPATHSFSATGSMGINRTSHGAVLLKNNKVLIVAGSYYYGYSNTAELYDPATGTFSTITGTMTNSRAWGLTTTMLNDGRVLIAGGGNSVYLNTAEIFDPASNQFSATGSMLNPRLMHTGTLLPDGKVLIAGGQNTSTTRITGVELFDPFTGTFSVAPNMSVERSGHTATLFPNGQVLVAGGASNLVLLSSAELFGPSSAGAPAVGYWKFDNSVNLGLDSSGNHNDGVVNTAYVTAMSGGVSSGAAQFAEGSNSGIRVPHSASLNISSNLTAMAWVKLDGTNTDNGNAVLAKGDSGGASEPFVFFATRSDSGGQMSVSGGFGKFDSGYTVPNNQWTHVAVTLDGASIRFYANGSLVNTQSYNGNMQQNTESLYIGASPWGSVEDFSGLMDEVKLYDRTLSASEIATATYTVITTTTSTSTSTSTTTSTSTSTATTSTTTASTTTTTLGGGTSAGLMAGWNLLGNGLSDTISVASVFGDTNLVTTVWKWISSSNSWAFYTPTLADGGAAYAASKGYLPLSVINGGEGFWVNAKSAFSVQLLGNTVPTGNFADGVAGNALPSGWSLIAIGDNKTPGAFINTIALTPPSAGTSVATSLTTLWAWDAGLSGWYFYAPSLVNQGTQSSYISSKGYLDFATAGKTLSPSTGFWVNHP